MEEGKVLCRRYRTRGLNYPPSINLLYGNGLDYFIGEKLNLKLGSIDVAVCNPPYLKLNPNIQYQQLLSECGFTSPIPILTTDIIFLAQNIRFLKLGGTLGIILPDGLLTSHLYERFRDDLLKNHTLDAIIQLPNSVFNKTEARTHIIILKKGQTKNIKNVDLYKVDQQGNFIDNLRVNREKLIYRMDFDFHRWKPQNNTFRSLASVDATIIRGNLSRKDLLSKNIFHFHTTDFKTYNNEAFFDEYVSDENLVYAKTNDILIARVGTRCIGKVCIIRSGFIPISDCIYCVRVSNLYIEDFWKELNSNNGAAWFKAHAHGVCSQVISKRDLSNFLF
jgi:hypothetical protein